MGNDALLGRLILLVVGGTYLYYTLWVIITVIFLSLNKALYWCT